MSSSDSSDWIDQNDEQMSLAGREDKQDEEVTNTIPIVDPSKAESRGVAPQHYGKHFVWSLTSDTMILLYKFMFTFAVGMLLYFIATLNVWCFFGFTVVLPMLLLMVHECTGRRLFTGFGPPGNPLSLVKYVTFAAQNLALCLVYWYGTDEVLAAVSTWFIRLNVFEVLISCIVQRLYVYWIPSIALLLPLCGYGASAWLNFPRFAIVKHDRYLMLWEDWDPWFIIIYTGWFLGWILRGSDRIPTALHTLFPLFVPPQLWFSVRTFCGSFLLWWLYLTPIQKYVNTPLNLPEQPGFSEIFDALYVMVFLAAYAMPFCMEYMKFD